MIRLCAPAAIAVLVGFAATPASASLLDVSSGTANFIGAHKSGAFTDLFTFLQPSDGKFDLSITSSVASLSQTITAFTETLTGPSFPSGIGVIANTVATPPGKQSAELFGNIIAGDYTIAISGTYSDTGASYGGSLATTVSTVPLPGSVALFGTAVMGLGIAGAMRRKTSRSAVSTA